MRIGVGTYSELFLSTSSTFYWIKMNFYALLAILFWASCTCAQQYGPVPPRPQQFAGANLIQPARPNFRQRPGVPRIVPENIQPVEQVQGTLSRRPQPLRKTKTQFTQSQTADQQRTNLVDDVTGPFANKIAAPTPLPPTQSQAPKILTPRPVEEEVNEDEEIPTTSVTTPSSTTYGIPLRTAYPPAPAPAPLQVNQIPVPYQRPQQFAQPSAFRPAAPLPVQPVQLGQPVQSVQYTGAPIQGRQLVRQQLRPTSPVQQVPVQPARAQIPQVVQPQIPAAPEPILEEDPYYRQVPARPAKRPEPVRQQVVEREPIRQQPARQSIRAQEITGIAQRQSHVKAPQKERKPVVQTIRKYHEEHEDGSITWGYENDDGSFKEETIGVDCVTRGKYGYYDPDGVKREYTYQTGIPCDKTQEAEEAASNQGFIDYTNNKYVLPNGDEIDLEAMVKNRARKPVHQYRN